MSSPHRPMLGIIGGTGMAEALGSLGSGEHHRVDTPFGPPSSPITVVELGGAPVALLPRHGEGHRFPPGRIPYRANVFALKAVGVTHVLATAAVGSLREEIRPGELVVPDQIIDRTFRREPTFFEDLAVHVEFAQPFCAPLREVLLAARSEVRVHDGGTYVCMEGPQFSTRAESDLHRSWGAHLIGMTLMPEAKLAREAELCYGAVNLVTDYDCWRPHPADLGGQELLEEIIGNLRTTTAAALALIRAALPAVQSLAASGCGCQESLERAIFTAGTQIHEDTRRELDVLLRRALRNR
ncbi:MAG TPA: S-methyl-5'-thioadenosine phosphorylase [Myxococcaceae bacterium]|nr:S-methyl-5'-thioadenosine phosphorylase [Myxococcaceae bacterium]